MAKDRSVIMKCLVKASGLIISIANYSFQILLAAMSAVLGDADPSADPLYYGAGRLQYCAAPFRYGAGVPYQPHDRC